MEQITAKVIGDTLHGRFNNHDHVFRNKYIFPKEWHESDFFCVEAIGYYGQ